MVPSARFSPLSDVTLTMIVRDELMNPAGGLHAVLSRHLPYFEEVVVLDTGSVDGTRQLLEQMDGEFPQLRVYDTIFRGYGAARNTAKAQVRTKYTFMLDADEVLERPERFVEAMKIFSGKALCFKLVNVYLDGTKRKELAGWNPRLFQPDEVTIVGSVYEIANSLNLFPAGILQAPIPFLHFTLFEEQFRQKSKDWYEHFNRWEQSLPDFPPSKSASFSSWKTPNPAVLKTYGIDVVEEIKYLESSGLQLHLGIAEQLLRCTSRK